MPVAQLQRQMSSSEFSEWMAYYSIEPFGEERADWRGALVPYMLACFMRKKGRKPRFEEFMLSTQMDAEPKKAESTKTMMAKLKGIASRFGKVMNNGSSR
jgi:hypothetical protein